MRHALLVAVAASSIVVAALAPGHDGGETIRYVDPPVDRGDAGQFEPTGTPEVDIGFYVEQLYVPLYDGDPCPIVQGLQGGTWTMPAVRTQGIGTPADVTCSLVTESGVTLGSATSEAHTFYLATDGWLEVQSFPVPVEPPDDAAGLEALYGQSATLGCTVEDAAGRSATRNVQVVLSEG